MSYRHHTTMTFGKYIMKMTRKVSQIKARWLQEMLIDMSFVKPDVWTGRSRPVIGSLSRTNTFRMMMIDQKYTALQCVGKNSVAFYRTWSSGGPPGFQSQNIVDFQELNNHDIGKDWNFHFSFSSSCSTQALKNLIKILVVFFNCGTA